MTYIREVKFPFNVPYSDEYLIQEFRSEAKQQIKKNPLVQNYGIDYDATGVSESARAFFHTKGYDVVGCEYFYFEPFFAMGIHIDGSMYCEKSKFNWVINNNIHHIFKFFEPLEDGKTDAHNDGNSPYSLQFEENMVEEKACDIIRTPSLCKVGVPHQVINGQKELELFNICIWKRGIKITHIDLGGMDMEDALRDFNEYLV